LQGRRKTSHKEHKRDLAGENKASECIFCNTFNAKGKRVGNPKIVLNVCRKEKSGLSDNR